MKIVSKPTTIARTPRPSAKPARMIARPRIWPPASGLRPIAPAASPPRIPMPMPGPITPIAASPAPMCSISFSLLCWLLACVRRGGVPFGHVHCFLADVPLFLMVALDRAQYEDEGQDAEDDGLDEIEHALEQQQRHRQEHHRQSGDDADCDLTGVDVPEKSHRERDWLDELEHQLDQADEHGDEAGADAVLEFVERKELAQVATHAELAEALDFKYDEGGQGKPDGDVDVARRCTQELDLADRRHQARPVAQQNQQEKRSEDRDVGRSLRATDRQAEVADRFERPLRKVLDPAGYVFAQSAEEERGNQQRAADDPHREQRRADAHSERHDLTGFRSLAEDGR